MSASTRSSSAAVSDASALSDLSDKGDKGVRVAVDRHSRVDDFRKEVITKKTTGKTRSPVAHWNASPPVRWSFDGLAGNRTKNMAAANAGVAIRNDTGDQEYGGVSSAKKTGNTAAVASTVVTSDAIAVDDADKIKAVGTTATNDNFSSSSSSSSSNIRESVLLIFQTSEFQDQSSQGLTELIRHLGQVRGHGDVRTVTYPINEGDVDVDPERLIANVADFIQRQEVAVVVAATSGKIMGLIQSASLISRTPLLGYDLSCEVKSSKVRVIYFV